VKSAESIVSLGLDRLALQVKDEMPPLTSSPSLSIADCQPYCIATGRPTTDLVGRESTTRLAPNLSPHLLLRQAYPNGPAASAYSVNGNIARLNRTALYSFSLPPSAHELQFCKFLLPIGGRSCGVRLSPTGTSPAITRPAARRSASGYPKRV
jgi:hypothetical protein